MRGGKKGGCVYAVGPFARGLKLQFFQAVQSLSITLVISIRVRRDFGLDEVSSCRV